MRAHWCKSKGLKIKMPIWMLVFIVGGVLFSYECVHAEKSKSPAESYNLNITFDNWFSHPKIREVRDIYRDVMLGMGNGSIRVEKTVYDIYSERCRDLHIDELSEKIGIDARGVVRYFEEERFITSSVVGVRKTILDSAGVARFVYENFGNDDDNVRVYFDSKGELIFKIEQAGGKFLPESATTIVPYLRAHSLSTTSDVIKNVYKKHKKCPVDKEKSTELENLGTSE